MCQAQNLWSMIKNDGIWVMVIHPTGKKLQYERIDDQPSSAQTLDENPSLHHGLLDRSFISMIFPETSPAMELMTPRSNCNLQVFTEFKAGAAGT